MLVAYHHGKHLCSHEEQRFLLLLLLGNYFHKYNDLADNSIDTEKRKGFLCEERENNEVATIIPQNSYFATILV